MRLGIYGGTFDPIHFGHLLLAETVRETLNLDAVWFVPAYLNPHKLGRPMTAPKARLEMLRFALAGNSDFRIYEQELKRKGPSFTLETLQKIHRDYPTDELFLLTGADSLADFPNWREPETILQLAQLVVVNRGRTAPEIPAQLDSTRVQLVEMPAIDISSSEIRRRARLGASIRYLTPRSVELFIQANQLYAGVDSASTIT